MARQAGDPLPLLQPSKIKLDENVTAAAKALLTRHGYECDTVADEGLTGAADAALIEVCGSQRRMLITFDLGFGDVRVYPPADHPGIVLLRLRDQQPEATLRALRALLAERRLEDFAGRLAVVTDDRIRVRSS